jgi:hypothetical protein
MAQVVEQLPRKHKALSETPKYAPSTKNDQNQPTNSKHSLLTGNVSAGKNTDNLMEAPLCVSCFVLYAFNIFL